MRLKSQRREPEGRFGAPHRHFAQTDSTNTRARELAAAGAPGGTVVTAAEQSAGRGRQGRTWSAPAGGALLYSAIVRPLDERHLTLPLAAPLAVCEAAERLRPGVECGVKWPNDVHLEGRKLAGVLIEARPQDGWAVVGVGLNLTIATEQFPPELRDTAISLWPTPDDAGGAGGAGGATAAGPGDSLTAIAARVLSERLGVWTAAEPEAVLAEWRARDVLRGREISWGGGSGVADGVDDRGFLLVLTAEGERLALGAGEVHIGRVG